MTGQQGSPGAPGRDLGQGLPTHSQGDSGQARPPEGSHGGFLTLAVDPGMDTGMAWLWRSIGSGKKFGALELPCWEAVDLAAGLMLEYPERMELVCELYLIGPQTLKKSRQYWSLESQGALRWLCRSHALPFTGQKPDDRKFGSDAKLKKLGWHRPSRGGHMVSATAHLLSFLNNTHQLSRQTLEVLATL